MSHKELRYSLEAREQAKPADFLVIDFNHRFNLWGKLVVEGKITNTATIASYKDIRIHLEYRSKKGKALGQENISLEKTLRPGKSMKYRFRLKAPKGTRTVNHSLEGAKPLTK